MRARAKRRLPSERPHARRALSHACGRARIFDRHQDVANCPLAHDGGKELNERRTADWRATIKPRSIGSDAHVDIAAVGQIPRRRRPPGGAERPVAASPSPRRAPSVASASSVVFSRLVVGESDIFVLRACVERAHAPIKKGSRRAHASSLLASLPKGGGFSLPQGGSFLSCPASAGLQIWPTRFPYRFFITRRPNLGQRVSTLASPS